MSCQNIFLPPPVTYHSNPGSEARKSCTLSSHLPNRDASLTACKTLATKQTPPFNSTRAKALAKTTMALEEKHAKRSPHDPLVPIVNPTCILSLYYCPYPSLADGKSRDGSFAAKSPVRQLGAFLRRVYAETSVTPLSAQSSSAGPIMTLPKAGSCA
jgi:hypothetical protein